MCKPSYFSCVLFFFLDLLPDLNKDCSFYLCCIFIDCVTSCVFVLIKSEGLKLIIIINFFPLYKTLK
ncbi:hypothetical protein QVD17_06577 [Tagetes erecta]|uniref:Uncharacterized protein n=1 Tax=Tagetes erecta TaxID=13708 RepID=A0AAD8PCB8_TARER|nr:hypothetical protein QVD17_06577 [Tagetes erecta]